MSLPAIHHIQQWGETLQLLVELTATASFAMSGVIKGAVKQLDLVGICVVGFLTAFGGGTLRDLLLDQRPFFWVLHVELLWGLLGLCLLAMLFMRRQHFELTLKTIEVPDAMGLGLFTATGVHQALLSDMPGLVAVLMGVITGVFGGVLRDIVCNEIPSAFSDHRPYAICAFTGGWAYVGLWQLGQPGWLALIGCTVITAGLRALVVWRNWQLPAWKT